MRKLNKRQLHHITQVKERFIEERLKGYLDTNGTFHPAISKQEAQAMWDKVPAQKFEDAMFDPEIIRKLELDRDEAIPAEWIKPI